MLMKATENGAQACVCQSVTVPIDLWHGRLSDHTMVLHFLVKRKDRVLGPWLGTPGLMISLYVIPQLHVVISP